MRLINKTSERSEFFHTDGGSSEENVRLIFAGKEDDSLIFQGVRVINDELVCLIRTIEGPELRHKSTRNTNGSNNGNGRQILFNLGSGNRGRFYEAQGQPSLNGAVISDYYPKEDD